MASLIPGYAYDIFISYRQKDNKGEKWVSEFVEGLKIELEATFKEEVSVYFDINPHDGLLETHEVVESLKGKLKCLIFIPVISRTYCDPKSFAWEHEFKAFVEQASGDSFGLKIKIPYGNVASRVLPVRIHELDDEDMRLCESITDGVLRGVEFIYKEPGVNRPLTPDDDEKLNLNRTKYRNQINKVANAIHDVIKGLKYASSGESEESGIVTPLVIRKADSGISGWRIPSLGHFTTKKLIAAVISIVIIFFVIFLVIKPLRVGSAEKTLALIPLRISNMDTTLQTESEYSLEALTNKLNLIRRIDVKPTISTISFRNSERSFEELKKELGTGYLLDGNIRREKKNIKIWIELIELQRDKLLWSGTLVWEKSKSASITRELSEIIAAKMNIRLTEAESGLLLNEPSRFPEASRNYISANIIMRDAWTFFNYGHKMLDSVSFGSAIESYNRAIIEDSLFALAYAKRAQAITWGIYDRQLDSSYLEKFRNNIDKALSIDNDLPDIQVALGLFYYFCEDDLDKALFYFNQASQMEQGNYQPIYYQSLVYRKMGKWKESQELVNRVIKFNPQEALFLTNIGLSFDYLHKYDSAIIFHQKAIDIVPGWPAGHVNKIQSQVQRDGNTVEARKTLVEAVRKTGDPLVETKIQLEIYDKNFNEAFSDALKSDASDYIYSVTRLLNLARISYLKNRTEDAKAFGDSAAIIVQSNIKNNPENAVFHSFAGLAYAYKGETQKAVEEGEKAVILATKNMMLESDMKLNLAIIYNLVKEFDKSSSLLSFLLHSPSFISGELILLDPIWKPLIDNAEYRQLIITKR